MTNEQRLGLWGGFRAKPLLLNTGNAYDRVPGTLHSTIAELAVFTCACQRSAPLHLASSSFYSLLNPSSTHICLIFQNLSQISAT